MIKIKHRTRFLLPLCATTLFFFSSVSGISGASIKPSVESTSASFEQLRASASSINDPYLDFKPALEMVMSKLLKSYQAQVDEPLAITVLSSSHEGVGDFISGLSASSTYDPSISLGIHFEKNAEFNGVKSSTCTLQYRPEGVKNIIRSYEQSKIFSRKDILHYIAGHEMGHCLAYHQSSLGKFKALSIKEHELLADKFAVSFFYLNGEPESARRVVEFNRRFSTSEMHRHPEALKSYVDYLDILFKNNPPNSLINTTLDLFYLASDQGEKI